MVKRERKQKILDDFCIQGTQNYIILLTIAKTGPAFAVFQFLPWAQCHPLRRGQTEHFEIYKVFKDDFHEQRIDLMQFRKVDHAREILDNDEDQW
jgi:hypothetical protein